jgi:hypothetical protein
MSRVVFLAPNDGKYEIRIYISQGQELAMKVTSITDVKRSVSTSHQVAFADSC